MIMNMMMVIIMNMMTISMVICNGDIIIMTMTKASMLGLLVNWPWL